MKKSACAKMFYTKLWIRVFSVMIFNPLISCSSVEELCNELLPDGNYEVYKAPRNNGGAASIPSKEPLKKTGNPLNVFLGFQVLDIGEVNEEKMNFRLHLFIMYVWNDTRLKLDPYTGLGQPAILYSECKNHIWKPDVFFETAKHIETYQRTSPTTILNIFEDGSIVMSVRYSFKADCSMEFDAYPFDTQRCQFLVSLMYSHDSVATLKWLDDKECPVRDPPIQMMRNIDMMQFYLLDPGWNSFTKFNNDGNHTTLVAEFIMVRRLTGCVLSTFAPSVLIVIMSWVTFWLRMDAIPARVALSITSLLTLCTQAQQSKSHLPPISYMTAMDIWLFMCIIMVFSTLVVSALSYNVFSMKCKKCSSTKEVDSSGSKTPAETTTAKKKNGPWILSGDKRTAFPYAADTSLSTNFAKSENCALCRMQQNLGYRIDDLSKIAFPSSFIIASVSYCCYYLNLHYNNY